VHEIADSVDLFDQHISDLEAGRFILDRNHQFETIEPVGSDESG
jgi:hypothetical protein